MVVVWLLLCWLGYCGYGVYVLDWVLFFFVWLVGGFVVVCVVKVLVIGVGEKLGVYVVIGVLFSMVGFVVLGVGLLMMLLLMFVLLIVEDILVCGFWYCVVGICW